MFKSAILFIFLSFVFTSCLPTPTNELGDLQLSLSGHESTVFTTIMLIIIEKCNCVIIEKCNTFC